MSWKLDWFDTPQLGRSGFVQTRLKRWAQSTDFPMLELAEIEFHAPSYYIRFHRMSGATGHDESTEFPTLEEAKAYAAALVRLS